MIGIGTCIGIANTLATNAAVGSTGIGICIVIGIGIANS